MMEIVRYTDERQGEWNLFVAESKNGTFLFDRRYMDYHRDRFLDHSLMFYLKGRLYALLPANQVGSELISHQGLTYGGLILDHQATTSQVLELFVSLNEYLQTQGISHVVYRPTPWIYHTLPAEEDLYAIVEACHAQLIAREVSTTFAFGHQQKWATLRTRCLKKAQKAGLEVRWTNDFEAFWPILANNLRQRYGLNPVHRLEEILLLQERFPQQIRLMGAFDEGRMVGGMVLYLSRQVVHSQYIAASEEGKQKGALDRIVYQLQQGESFSQPYFDFGKSTEEHGDVLNQGLIHQKEGFGGRAVCYDTYVWDVPSLNS